MASTSSLASTYGLQTALDRVSAVPRLWNGLRWLVEAGFHGERAVIARELRPWAGDARRFLDLGCGTGEFAGDFPARRYVGIDPAVGYLRFAVRHRPGAFLAGAGEALPFADASFDAALVLGVLHHLPDEQARAVMAELARVLQPGATALIMEDTPPPPGQNPAGQLMHAIDRGSHIRTNDAYRALFSDWFTVVTTYAMRSGICDYAVYVLSRATIR
ncbi:MAG: class I SAM-dependent methyltransferase [Chloroflexi bacterium]|nr:class I SAM-dependent methyltransferase [Chloroflexota bacterium]